MRKFALPALLCTVVATGGCSIFHRVNPLSHEMALYNHAGRAILVGNQEARNGDTLSVGYDAGSTQPLFIFAGGCVLSYTNIPAPPSGYSGWDVTHSGVNVQLEADGRIYAVHSAAKVPAEVKAEGQPAGFPLVPLRGSGCAVATQ
jgi:hypothetical protein